MTSDRNIRVAEMFAGVGGFRLALDGYHREGTSRFDMPAAGPFKTIWANQWEPDGAERKQFAWRCYEARFGAGSCINKDISKVMSEAESGQREIPDFDMLVGGFPCLTGDSLVLTSTGYKRIDEIKTGDMVIGHDGSYHNVKRFVPRGKKNVYNVKASGCAGLRATGNHRLYVHIADNNDKIGEAQWLTVDDVRREMEHGKRIFLDMPSMSLENVANEKIDTGDVPGAIGPKKLFLISNPLFWYIAGRYIASGYDIIHGDDGETPHTVGICFRISRREIGRIGSLSGFNITFIYDGDDNDDDDTVKCVSYNMNLISALNQFNGIIHVGNADARNGKRRIPGFMLNIRKGELAMFVEGLMGRAAATESDTDITLRDAGTAYEALALLEKIYKRAFNIQQLANGDYRIAAANKEEATYVDGHILHKVTSIDSLTLEEDVYDIEVEDSHSFVANGAIVHNCQDYSIAKPLSRSNGIEGKKGVLWWDIYRMLKIKHPHMILLENVDRLLNSPVNQRGRDFAIILSCLNELGYSVEWRVINAADYGMPQKRRRTYIYGELTDETWDLHDRIATSNGIISEAFPASEIKNEHDITISGSPYETSASFGKGLKTSPFMTAGCMQQGTVATGKAIPEYSGPTIVLSDIMVPDADVPSEFFIPDDEIPKWEYQRQSKKIKRTSKDGHEYTYSEGSMAFPDPTDKPARTILTSEGSRSASRMTHAVQGDSGRIRRLVPDELDAIQMFPKGWTSSIYGGTDMSDRQRAFCMGNALVVGIPHRIGTIIAQRQTI